MTSSISNRESASKPMHSLTDSFFQYVNYCYTTSSLVYTTFLSCRLFVVCVYYMAPCRFSMFSELPRERGRRGISPVNHPVKMAKWDTNCHVMCWKAESRSKQLTRCLLYRFQMNIHNINGACVCMCSVHLPIGPQPYPVVNYAVANPVCTTWSVG